MEAQGGCSSQFGLFEHCPLWIAAASSLPTYLFIGKMRSTPGTRRRQTQSRSRTQRGSVVNRFTPCRSKPHAEQHAGFGEQPRHKHTSRKKVTRQRRDPPRQPVSAAGLIMPHPHCSRAIPSCRGAPSILPSLLAQTLTLTLTLHRACPPSPLHLRAYVLTGQTLAQKAMGNDLT